MTVKLKVESSRLKVQGSKFIFGQRSFIKAVKRAKKFIIIIVYYAEPTKFYKIHGYRFG